MKKRVSVAFVLPDARAGGAQHVMLSFASALDSERFAVDVILVCGGGHLAVDLPTNVRITEIGATRLLRGLPKLMLELHRIRPQIVVSVMGYLNLALLAMRPMLKSKLIIREANTVAATEAMLPRWLPARWSYRILYPRANAVVAPTDEIKEQIATFVSKAAAPLVIANPVDEQTLRQRATPPARPAGRGLVIVGAGRLTTQKGFDRLLEIVPLLPADARLFIFGDGGDRPFLNERVRSLGLADRVSFAGFNASLPASIAGADVFVLPSRWEGLSNVSLEALAVGTPVIAAEEAGLQEVARAAPAGAVTIAAVGPDFATAISRIQPNNAGQSVPRPSLLPAKYRTANAAAEFANLLLRVAA